MRWTDELRADDGESACECRLSASLVSGSRISIEGGKVAVYDVLDSVCSFASEFWSTTLFRGHHKCHGMSLPGRTDRFHQ